MKNELCHNLVRLTVSLGTAMFLVVTFARPVAYAQYGSPPGAERSGGIINQLPPELEAVGLTEKLGESVPHDLLFLDEAGRQVRLGDYFDHERPVILNIGYYGCPMLCGLVMQGLLESLQDINFTAGTEFQVISVSIDPTETPALAAEKKRAYIHALGRPEADSGWHFLTGQKPQIDALTEAVGFDYKWISHRQEYAHAAALIILMPDGTVSRYLPGIRFEPRTLRLSLVEASEGKVGSTLDYILLMCLHFDPTLGAYTPAAMAVMRIGGVLTVVLIGATIGGLLWFERRHGTFLGRRDHIVADESR